ncbi:MAG: hypothetical protein Fur0019_06230 [Tibeticola sp.]
MPRPSPKPADSTVAHEAQLPASYELAVQELEQLVSRLESGQLPLDELLGAYRRGAALLAFCRERLQAVEEQVKLLDEGDLKPWTAS